MSKYTIRLNYTATFTTTVEGDFRNEDDAERAWGEEADDYSIKHFTENNLVNEL